MYPTSLFLLPLVRLSSVLDVTRPWPLPCFVQDMVFIPGVNRIISI